MSEPLMLANYRDIIASMPPIMSLGKQELLIEQLHVHSFAPLELYYAPHNDVAMEQAKLLIVGLTPGFQQMQLALAEAQQAIWQDETDRVACLRAKHKARFAGAMRSNLVSMLDRLGLHHWLGLESSSSLFDEHFEYLDSTSIIPFPTFHKGRNYSGSQPDLLKLDSLCEFIESYLHRRLHQQPHLPIIPLGRTVEAMMTHLVGRGLLVHEQVLWNFPHPSGANGHRHQQFIDYEKSMKRIMKEWFNS